MSNITDWHVLLVDDEPDSLELISEVLTHAGAEVFRTSSGDECLHALSGLTPTLLIVDLNMPRPDGWDLLGHIRGNPATENIPVVAITAYHSTGVARQAQETGFNAYIPKPIKSQHFIEVLESIIE
jgi:CheY-like chemotaxis protein